MTERDTTYQALLDCAIRLFGQHGYSAVSTRMLAEHAEVNVAAIKYHFGSKEGLYIGAIDAITELLQPGMAMIKQISTQAKKIAGDDPTRRAQVISEIVDSILTIFLTLPRLQVAIPFVLRELFVPGPHFDRFYTAVPEQVHHILTDLVAWILNIEPESDLAKIRTHALIGQIIIFHLGRPILLRRLGTDDYSEQNIDEIRGQVTVSILSSLGLPHEH